MGKYLEHIVECPIKQQLCSSARGVVTPPVDIPPIETEAEYRSILKRIDDLWDAIPNTSAGDELDTLVTLITIYEEVNFPISKPGSK